MSLLKIAPKLNAGGSSAGASNSNSDPTANPGPLRRIPYACISCKKAKTKCSGLPSPCTRCNKLGAKCVFDEATDQRRRVAAKRTTEDLKRYQDRWGQLMTAIAQANHKDLFQLQGLAQRGGAVEEIDAFIQSKLGLGTGDSALSSGTVDTEAEMTGTKDLSSPSTSTTPPEPDGKRQMIGELADGEPRQIRWRGASDAYQEDNASRRRPSDVMAVSALCDIPPIRVPVDDWIMSIDDDEDLLSHLISLFFTWFNPFWRLVDQDIFLDDMQNADAPDPLYCSPLLVHSMLAIASHSSDHSAVFLDQKNPMTRGLLFYRQARELWEKEQGKASLTNIQALSILALDSLIRGRDKYCWELLNDLRNMFDGLGLRHDPSEERLHGVEDPGKFIRVWRTVSWAVFNLKSLFSLIMLKPPEIKVPLLARPYVDGASASSSVWLQYPGVYLPRVMSADLAFVVTSELMVFCSRLSDLMFSYQESSESERSQYDGRAIAREIQTWESGLPQQLRYHKGAVPLVFEFQVCKAYVKLMMFSFFQQLQITRVPSGVDHGSNDDLHAKALDAVHEITELMRLYREEFTFEYITVMMVSAAYLGCCVLLEDIADSRCASDFVDLFQCFFAGGHRFLFARSLAQMTLWTASKMSKNVPQQALDMVKGGALVDPNSDASLDRIKQQATSQSWLPRNILQTSSFFPHYNVNKGANPAAAEDFSIDDLVHKWDGMGLSMGPIDGGLGTRSKQH